MEDTPSLSELKVLVKLWLVAIRFLKLWFINGFSKATIIVDISYLMSTTHNVLDFVSNQNALNFLIFIGKGIGFEISHSFLHANFFILLEMHAMKKESKTSTNAKVHEVAKIGAFDLICVFYEHTLVCVLWGVLSGLRRKLQPTWMKADLSKFW